jgi:hypothetical protein
MNKTRPDRWLLLALSSFCLLTGASLWESDYICHESSLAQSVARLYALGVSLSDAHACLSVLVPADSTDREPTETNEGSQGSDQSERRQLEFDSLRRC